MNLMQGEEGLPSVSALEAELSERARTARATLRRRMRRWYIIALVLFVLTCFSTYYRGGPTFALALMGILLAHELGHFFQSLRYRVPATPPLFIPMPAAITGTMGAVILQGAGFANRKALFDIAVSGPLAGLVLALPIAWFGVQQAKIGRVPEMTTTFGHPLILQWMVQYHHGELPPGFDVILNPLLFAGWVGIFITALNLIPIGQLDGGHILYTLLGRRANQIVWLVVLGAAGWMILKREWSYAPFLILILVLGRGPEHPPSADDSVPLGAGRIVLGWLTLAFFVIGFIPRPLNMPSPPAEPDPRETPLQVMIDAD